MTNSDIAENVIPFPTLARTIPADKAGPFTFAVWAATERIGGDALNTIYGEDFVLVDPDAPLEDDCLFVFQIRGGRPHVSRCRRTGRDYRGRFVPSGDRRECFSTDFGFSLSMEDHLRFVRILGRVVGDVAQRRSRA